MNRPEGRRLAAILPAAGPSTRLGQSKQLVRMDGESLVRRAARLLLALEPESVTVVSGSDSGRVTREVEDLPVSVIHNPDWRRGMGGSIACGVHSLVEAPKAVLILLCDQWRLEKEDIERLIEAWNADISRIVAASWFRGKSRVYGPPVVFPGEYIRELKFLDEKRGAKYLIDREPGNVRFVRMDNAGFDLDCPADLDALRSR